MNKILKSIIPVLFCASLIVPNGISVKAETMTNTKLEAKATSKKRIVTYFPSWGTYQAGQQNITVSNIAWDKVTHVNHGFFEITNDYKIQTTDSYADYENEGFGHGPKQDWDKYPITGVPAGTVYGHFGEYKYYKEKYPDVKLLISVGGWTRSDKFHELAKSPTHRKTLAMSMVNFMKKYPFIDGMDIDWEYPGITRASEDQYDRGCVGGPEDKENFTLLLKDIRETFNANGMSEKLLTVAVSAGEAKIKMTEPDKYAKYVDYIGVMTYDFAGSWDNVTGNLAGLYQNPADKIRPKFNMDDAMKIFKDEYKVPADKILAGTPLYSRGWGGVEPGPNGDGLFQSAKSSFKGNLGDGGQYSWYDIPAMEKSSEWQKFRDPIARTPYLYNKSKKQFITYEDEQSLTERVSYVNKNNYGGLIVWDASGDNIKAGHPMHTIMYNGFKN
ncbi:glycoside hydrolase family 18 protein [Clostridium gasigenes]|uniref:glycoside hydrolase family 18 protein n=1 Tax=Clostridium gasigenes TaxID=94869 RepID=UPI001C0D3682|nr:glycoside hydrolase family 18 protein [Clostridium gasigenes]MBU3087929.1 glycoside hydrolase family 18 protein [Clostridium gasigenes]